jgi:hypothetical protein
MNARGSRETLPAGGEGRGGVNVHRGPILPHLVEREVELENVNSRLAQ